MYNILELTGRTRERGLVFRNRKKKETSSLKGARGRITGGRTEMGLTRVMGGGQTSQGWAGNRNPKTCHKEGVRRRTWTKWVTGLCGHSGVLHHSQRETRKTTKKSLRHCKRAGVGR